MQSFFRRDKQRKKKFYTKDMLGELDHIVEVGDYTYGRPSIFHWGEKAILKIGKFCSIADDVVIFLGGNHRVDWITTYPFPALLKEWHEGTGIEDGSDFGKNWPFTRGDVIIENDVWIGYGATIMSGVNIGNGAVIGTRSVVTKNVEPYTIVAGNPARVIKKRFSDTVIEQLLSVRWWDWPKDKIQRHIKILCSPDHELLLKHASR